MTKSPEGQEPSNISVPDENKPTTEVVREAAKTPELTKEAEPKQGVFIIYRDNDLYHDNVPQIIDILRGNDRQVEVQVFPRGTNETQIADWFQKNSSRLSGKLLISDYTFERSLGKDARSLNGVVNRGGEMDRHYLDTLFDDAIARVVTGARDLKEFREGVPKDKMEGVITNILKRSLENPEKRPKRLIVVMSQIAHHAPISSWVTRKESPARKDEILKEKMLKLLSEAGIPPEIVEFVFSSDQNADYNKLEGLDQENNWIIIDRHADFGKEPDKAVNLTLPAADLIQSVSKGDLIKIDPTEIKGVIKDLIERDIERKFDLLNDDPQELAEAISLREIDHSKLTAKERIQLVSRLEAAGLPPYYEWIIDQLRNYKE